jgi:hypothetical protein
MAPNSRDYREIKGWIQGKLPHHKSQTETLIQLQAPLAVATPVSLTMNGSGLK